MSLMTLLPAEGSAVQAEEPEVGRGADALRA